MPHPEVEEESGSIFDFITDLGEAVKTSAETFSSVKDTLNKTTDPVTNTASTSAAGTGQNVGAAIQPNTGLPQLSDITQFFTANATAIIVGIITIFSLGALFTWLRK